MASRRRESARIPARGARAPRAVAPEGRRGSLPGEVCCSGREAFARVALVQATMIAGVLGMLTAWPSPHAPAPVMHTAMACPAAQSDAHRALLKQADAQVEAGDDAKAARTFVSAYDAMDLVDQVGNTGKFAADRAVTSYLKAWRIARDVTLLQEAERFLLRYLEDLGRGRTEGCTPVDEAWANEKLAEVRAEMPAVETPDDPAVVGPKPANKDCPAAPAIIGVDRAGVALVTVGVSVFVTGAALLVVGLVRDEVDGTTQALAITGGILMGGGVAFTIPGAVRLGTWKRKQSQVQLGMSPWTGRGLAGVAVGGRFGARR